MHIAFISTMAASSWAGSEELWIAGANAAVRAGHAVTASIFRWPEAPAPAKLDALAQAGAHLLWRRRYGLPSLDEAAIKAVNFVTGRIFSRHVQLPAALGAIGAKGAFGNIASRHPDIICVSQGWPFDMLDAAGSRTLLRQLRRSGIPYVILCHLNLDFAHPRDVVRQEVAELYAAARRVLFVSEHNWKVTERQLATRLPHASVVRNPVNLAEHAPLQWPNDTGIVRFATVARLDAAQKGHDILFEALSRAPFRERPNWRLHLFGGGEDERYLRRLCHHFELEGRVEFAGYVEDVHKIWLEHPLLLLPSRAEGTPLSLIEAMLCGRPAVVTDVGGNREWVDDGLTGYIAEAPTARSFSAALERAWTDRRQWQTRGRAAYRSATAKIDPEPGSRLLTILLEAAGTASPRK